jgi:hypothetical protein
MIQAREKPGARGTATAFSGPNVIAALLALMIAIFFFARWRQSVREARETAVDQRTAAEAIVAVEQFLGNLPRHIGNVPGSNTKGASNLMHPAELDWGHFNDELGPFLSWADGDTPAGMYLSRVRRTAVFDLQYLSFTRAAVFQNGTVKLDVRIVSGRTATGTPEVLRLDGVEPSQSSGIAIRRILVCHPRFVSH